MDENWDHYVTHIPRYDPARNSRVSMYDLKDLILTKTTTTKRKENPSLSQQKAPVDC